MSDRQQRLDFEAQDPLELRDAQARALAVDPRRNVALEASAGTGKTRVLVDRYLGLLMAGVSPRNILAITFTRKAAAEMRQRILQELERRHRDRTVTDALWREIRENLTDIAISTIDAFCLALLREFPLEADVDPGFELADETETPRLVEEALERTLRIGRGIAAGDPEMALLFAELGEYRLREGLARLLDRRLVAWDALGRFLHRADRSTIDEAVSRLVARLRAAFATVPRGVAALVDSGPVHPAFRLLAHDLARLVGDPPPSPLTIQGLLDRVREHLLTQDGEPRKRLIYKKSEFRSARDYERHMSMVAALAPHLVDALQRYAGDMNAVLARSVRQLFAIALKEYERTLRKNGVLDFADVLERTLALLSQMDEFSRSRFKLESRYQHVLVDEFQDTSRAQWQLVELLVRSWGAGLGVAQRELEPSIFVVGDRKQSIYGFRDAEVAVLDEAARYIEALRPVGQVRTAITRSFRSVRELLAFVNDLFAAVDIAPDRANAFRYSENDTFPTVSVQATESDALGIVAARSDEQQADIVAGEIARLLANGASIRDRETGLRRSIMPGDIGILFRTREGHRLFEDCLARRGVPFYVYKGLGFYDADEIKDILALMAFLARPHSELNAAAFLRSRFVRLSDEGLKHLAPSLSASLTSAAEPDAEANLHPSDRRRLLLARAAVPGWLADVDRVAPSELVDRVLAESAYAVEIGGAAGSPASVVPHGGVPPVYRQARENLKKARALIRRVQNRGYATLSRIVDHFEQLVAGGDESNAIVDATDAVNLMTVHAAKGLEFPVVFVVNLHRGSGGSSEAIRVAASAGVEPSVAIGEYESAADRDLEAREAEDSKRLLYVALTRARDRLYLAATVHADGRFVAGKGGLGRTLPPTFAALFTQATSMTTSSPASHRTASVDWAGATATHRLRVIGPSIERIQLDEVACDNSTDDFAQLSTQRTERVTVISVHADTHSVAGVSDLVRDVPFSLRRADGTIVRGKLDSVVRHSSGMLEVRAVKTGPPSPDDRAHLDDCIEAARALFPREHVAGRLIYADCSWQLSGR